MKAVKLILILVVLLIAISAVVDAKKFNENISVKTVYDTITQGESDWYCKYVSSSSFSVYLVWNNPSNSLTLTIYTPSGEVYGYHDADDGKVDGKITLDVVNAEQGFWFFKVYGEKVSGVQAYSLTIA